MILSRTASWLFLLLGAAAPWICGARSDIPHVLWLCGGVQVLGFLILLAGRWKQRRRVRVPRGLVLACVALAAFLGGWAFQDDPAFATPFTLEHWAFLNERFPTAILQWPRGERLWFLAGTLCTIVALAELGRDEAFRRRLCLVLGVSGLLVALGALAQRFGGAGHPPWLQIAGYTEAYNFTYFHHSGAAASFNMVWPLLVFTAWRGERRWAKIGLIAALAAMGAICFPLWRSESAWVIATIVAGCGVIWWLAARAGQARSRVVCVVLGGALLGALSLQLLWVKRTREQFPDGWQSVAQTQQTADVRDAELRRIVSQRGDRMAISPAPPRPVAWLAGLRMASAHPLFGDGPGSWVRSAVLYSNDPLVNTFYQHRQFAHHDLIQTAAEWGVVPALVWVFIWSGGIYRAVRRGAGGGGEIALVLALFALALHSLLHFPLQIPALQIWAALLLGAAWSRRPRAKAEADSLGDDDRAAAVKNLDAGPVERAR